MCSQPPGAISSGVLSVEVRHSRFFYFPIVRCLLVRFFSSVKCVKGTMDVCVMYPDNRINKNYNWNILSHKSFPVFSSARVHLTHLSALFSPLLSVWHKVLIFLASGQMLQCRPPTSGHSSDHLRCSTADKA